MTEWPSVQVEAWICSRLKLGLFDGITTPEQRRERVRKEILGRCLADAVAGRRKGQPCETWADVFQRVYGQPLIRPGMTA